MVLAMSALLSEAGIPARLQDVCYVPNSGRSITAQYATSAGAHFVEGAVPILSSVPGSMGTGRQFSFWFA
jgi:hypothetical protein